MVSKLEQDLAKRKIEKESSERALREAKERAEHKALEENKRWFRKSFISGPFKELREKVKVTVETKFHNVAKFKVGSMEYQLTYDDWSYKGHGVDDYDMSGTDWYLRPTSKWNFWAEGIRIYTGKDDSRIAYRLDKEEKKQFSVYKQILEGIERLNKPGFRGN